MAVLIRIPAPLRKLTMEKSVVECQGATIKDLLGDLEKQYPGMKERIMDENGRLRRFLNIFINGEDIRMKKGLDTTVEDKNEVSIVPAIAGGKEKKQLDLVFPKNLVKEPVIWKMSKKFEVIFNIRRAKVTEKLGELVLELEGEPDVINSAIDWLKAEGVDVKPITHDTVEG